MFTNEEILCVNCNQQYVEQGRFLHTPDYTMTHGSSSLLPLQTILQEYEQKQVVPKMRSRVHFTKDQRKKLEHEFNTHRYLNRIRRIQLSQSLNVPERKLRLWFNNRRVKDKKEEKVEPDPDSSARSTENLIASQSTSTQVQCDMKHNSLYSQLAPLTDPMTWYQPEPASIQNRYEYHPYHDGDYDSNYHYNKTVTSPKNLQSTRFYNNLKNNTWTKQQYIPEDWKENSYFNL